MKEKIKALRLDTELSQPKFGARYGIPLRTIQNWEYGINEPPQYVYDMLRRLIQLDNMHIMAYTLTVKSNARENAEYTFFRTYEEAVEYSWQKWNRLPMREQGRYITTKGARYDICYSEVEWRDGRFVAVSQEEPLWNMVELTNFK